MLACRTARVARPPCVASCNRQSPLECVNTFAADEQLGMPLNSLCQQTAKVPKRWPLRSAIEPRTEREDNIADLTMSALDAHQMFQLRNEGTVMLSVIVDSGAAG